jgi:hypothetical protein
MPVTMLGKAKIGQLRVGERIRTKTVDARIEAIRWKRGEYRVYNIVVEVDHVYFVSVLELLSHNSSPCQIGPSVKNSDFVVTQGEQQSRLVKSVCARDSIRLVSLARQSNPHPERRKV